MAKDQENDADDQLYYVPGIRETSPAGKFTSASASGGNDGDHGKSARSSPQPSVPSNEFDLMVNRYVAPGIFGEHGKSKLTPLPAHRPSLALNSHPGTGDSAVIAGLLARIRSLESREAAREGRPQSTNLAIREGSSDSPGRFIKSKFYGQSHWVNAIESASLLDAYDALGDGKTHVNHNTNRREVNKKTELYSTVTKIKQMARVIKTSRLLQPSTSAEVQNSIPPKDTCDLLIECYLRTFEGIFRVLHQSHRSSSKYFSSVQSSLDMGMPPMISVNDYDTKTPSNINDEDIGEGCDTPLDEKRPDEYTDSSIQIAFTKTLPIRLEIIRLINNLRFDLSYDDVLKTGSELNDACREQTIFLKSALKSGQSITPFQIKMADFLVRRFVLCLHRPYFAKAKENPQYHYSRKMCLDTSLAIYAPATEAIPGQEDDWIRMTHRSQIADRRTKACVRYLRTAYLHKLNTFDPPFVLPTQFQTLRNVLVSAHGTAIARLRNGETNAKGVVFLLCALTRIDALVSGEDADRAVLEAARKSVKEASQILAEVYEAEHGIPIDLNISISNKDHSRGDGADDVTGRGLQTGTNVAGVTNGTADGNFDQDSGPTFDPSTMDSSIHGLGMLDNGLGDLNGIMDIDIDAYLAGQSLDPGGSGYHFGRSPERFYDLDGWAAAGNFGNGSAGTPSL
ncbi:hypothetical protein EK21DRAFT_111702 [Setomelanomma holmii]|uniref:Uncharacterized protein n=1 Tax=Setomelanomma holmii TaxID=210430 RepID=A0A9P4HA17_9PLEO|nr:hypothetical protein EK21DRAFT_111702 [Setomelanomma holmii]